ncbi:MFS transporter [Streptomyces sp. SID3343]|uniref:MFS transporter n=1 Tax=Streptomyces sp. SID3343 TaxID=2690260 RepID=UPI00136BB8C7|nr:MFS transporter [Streptomyces sp. SID3343]MYW05916.1 MFS transporter [Streptomyces sp. SID3343]
MSGLLRRHRDFRLLWLGETSGKFGASVTSVAMPLIAVSTLHANTFEVALLGAAAWLPWLLIGLPAGVWVDRTARRPIMLASAAVSCALFVAVPLASWTGVLSVALLLAITLASGVAAVFFQTAYTAYLPTILTPADQSEGNSKLHGSASAAQIAGSGAGGLISQAAGAVNGMFVNAGTFLASLVCLLGIRHREPAQTTDRDPDRSLVREVGEGLRLVAGDRWLRTFAMNGGLSNLGLIGLQSIQVVFLVRTLGVSAGVVGVLLAAAALGGVLGAFVAPGLATRLGTSRAVLVLELGLPLSILVVPIAQDGPALALFVVGKFVTAAGVVAANVIRSGFQQRYCPPQLLGRVSASMQFVNYGTIPIGAVLAGALGSTIGVRPTMWVMAATIASAGLILYFSPVRHVRDLPTALEGKPLPVARPTAA